MQTDATDVLGRWRTGHLGQAQDEAAWLGRWMMEIMASYGPQSLPTLRAVLAAWLMVVAITGTAIAGPLEDAEAAYERGDYATAMRIFRPLADQGNSVAQNYLGDMHNLGEGVPQDYTEALRWYQLAADRGLANAKFKIGIMYDAGHGVLRNYSDAVKWYRLAADQGDLRAQFNLGAMYFQGHGVPQDYAEAVRWWRAAADQGDDTSQYSLGLMYANGHGVPRDYVRAHMWLNLAAAQRDYEAAVEERTKVENKMTPAQIAEAQRLAREWKPKPEQQ
jgi:uncharacterized protein